MGFLYSKEGKLYAKDYTEIYIPKEYIESGVANNQGAEIETFGVCYIRGFKGTTPGEIKLLSIPTIVKFMIYEFKYETIVVHGKSIDVMTLQYIKDSYVMHQSLTTGRDIANNFLSMVLSGKLPKTLNYAQTIDLWWMAMEISGVSFKVPSKMFELVLSAIYRSPNNTKERYGQYYGRQSNPNGYDYKTGNVRSVVKDLSTFSGMVFEDISTMMTNGINNSLENIDEPVSPLEKIIYY